MITRIQIEVTDADPIFDESDVSQTLTNDLTLDGVTYTAGTRILGNYVLTNATDPDFFSGTISAGGNTGRNTTDFVFTRVPLEPNTTYVYTAEENYNTGNNLLEYADFVLCFTKGTQIRTETGNRPVEELEVGDLVATRDNGLQPIRWNGSRTLDSIDLRAAPSLRPIKIKRGSLATNIPEVDLIVSPQHRVLVRSAVAQRMFGALEVLVPAKKLLALDGITQETGEEGVVYYHVLLERHEGIYSNEAPTESLYLGEQVLNALGKDAASEIAKIFPESDLLAQVPVPARFFPDKGSKAKRLAERLQKNSRHAFDTLDSANSS